MAGLAPIYRLAGSLPLPGETAFVIRDFARNSQALRTTTPPVSRLRLHRNKPEPAKQGRKAISSDH